MWKASKTKSLLARRDDWRERLLVVHDDYSRAQFQWGTYDCCLLIADSIRALTGHDPASGHFRYRYNNAKQALRLMREFAGGGVAETIKRYATLYNAREIPPGSAMFGDVGLFDFEDQQSGALITPDRYALLFLMREGPMYIPRGLLAHAWRV